NDKNPKTKWMKPENRKKYVVDTISSEKLFRNRLIATLLGVHLRNLQLWWATVGRERATGTTPEEIAKMVNGYAAQTLKSAGHIQSLLQEEQLFYESLESRSPLFVTEKNEISTLLAELTKLLDPYRLGDEIFGGKDERPNLSKAFFVEGALFKYGVT